MYHIMFHEWIYAVLYVSADVWNCRSMANRHTMEFETALIRSQRRHWIVLILMLPCNEQYQQGLGRPGMLMVQYVFVYLACLGGMTSVCHLFGTYGVFWISSHRQLAHWSEIDSRMTWVLGKYDLEYDRQNGIQKSHPETAAVKLDSESDGLPGHVEKMPDVDEDTVPVFHYFFKPVMKLM